MCRLRPAFAQIILLASLACALGAAVVTDPFPAPITKDGLVLDLEKVVQLPASSTVAPLARVALMRPVGDGSGRLFVNDLNGPGYMLVDGAPVLFFDFRAIFPNFKNTPGWGTGFACWAFHPDFATNRRLYTVHTENPGSALADLAGPVAAAPRAIQGVLTEWIVDDPAANAFAGTRRELLRIDFPHTIHDMQEIAFNPLARPGDADHGKLYLCLGDGGTTGRGFPDNVQRLDSPLGCILRIDPLGTNGRNGRYGIPADNPWAGEGDPATLDEIWAYGFRNPHRISWDAVTGAMFIGEIGEHNVEEINLGVAGANYGWNVREGTFLYDPSTPAVTTVQTLPPGDAALGYTYPVAMYDHDEGDSVAGGFVYRGGDLPALQGRYLFGDILRGRVFWIEATGLTPGTPAPIHEATLRLDGAEIDFLTLIGDVRVDLRLHRDDHDNLYLSEKRTGSIYRIVGATDTTASTERAAFVNVSTRIHVGTGDAVAILGFAVEGSGTRTVLIRGVGPTLGGPPFGVSDALADPVLAIHRIAGGSSTLIAVNDDWDSSGTLPAVFADTGAFSLAPGSADAAIVLTLAPGLYTATLAGANGTTGNALVELYAMP